MCIRDRAYTLALNAPSPVLLKMGLKTTEEISRLTGIPTQIASLARTEVIKEETIKESGIEERLINTFRNTIDRYKLADDVLPVSYTHLTAGSDLQMELYKSIIDR